MNIKNKVKILKENSEVSWFIADRWFRILEFSLLLGILHYIKEISSSVSINILYWLSWTFFWSWFEDIGKLIYEMINSRKALGKPYKAVIWILSILLVIIIYLLVTTTADSIIKHQYS